MINALVLGILIGIAVSTTVAAYEFFDWRMAAIVGTFLTLKGWPALRDLLKMEDT